MHAEREELVKRVFPRLRAICERRSVNCTEIDLRWGVSDEQQEQGLALSICLDEIRDCRPFFIGILGERYGWIPEVLSPETLKEHPWLTSYTGRSITELEILFGALEHPELAEYAFFYFRDSPAAFSKHKKPQGYGDLSDGLPARMLADLKQRIRGSGFPVRENVQNAKQLGEMVYRDLLNEIDRLYPAAAVPDELDRQSAAHGLFAEHRRLVFEGRTEHFERLDEHVAGNGMPLVVAGDPGCGKSAVLANWLAKRRLSHCDERTIEHFVGAATDSAYWPEILRRISGELWRQFAERLEIPSGVDPAAERAAFLFRLAKFAAQGQFIVVIDGLDHLEQRERGLELDWLPASVPTACRLIVSTGSSRQLAKLCERGWPVLTIGPLDIPQRESIVTRYLGQYRKTLSLARTHRIASAHAAANALYLRTLVEELRLFGSHEALDRQISHYLASSELDELFAKALERIERDFAHERPALVRDAISLLWVSRSGLLESELLDLLGGSEPLGGVLWTQLRLAFGTLLADRSGIFTIDALPLRVAIKERYFPDTQLEDDIRWRLVAYYQNRPHGARKHAELPWQLFCLGAWDRLTGLLADPSYLESAWNFDARAISLLWRQIESLSASNRLDAYAGTADWLPDHPNAVRIAIDLLRQWEAPLPEMHHAAQRLVISLVETLVAHFRGAGSAEALATTLRLQIELLLATGEGDRALATLPELRQAYADAGNLLGFVAEYRGIVDSDTVKETPAAIPFYTAFEDAAFALGNIYYLDGLFTEHAETLRGLGRPTSSLELVQVAERNLSGKAALALASCLRAIFLYRTGRTVEADEVIRRVRELSDVDKQAEALTYVMRSRNGPSVQPSQFATSMSDATAITWTAALPSTYMPKQQSVSTSDADEIRQRIAALEDAGDYAAALETCERLTTALRDEDHPKRLRNHLMIAARLLKHHGRIDEARRVAREIVSLTSEYDLKNLELFRELIAANGLAD